MRTVTITNPDEALRTIGTFSYGITTAEVVRVDDYGAVIVLINADGTRQPIEYLLGREDFRMIFGEECDLSE